MNRTTLCKRLKKARLEAGLRQEDVSKVMGLPVSGISILEAGNRKLDVLELIKLAELYSKPPEWFFAKHDSTGKRRWYDLESSTKEAIELLRHAPLKIQASLSCAIIAFLKKSEFAKND